MDVMKVLAITAALLTMSVFIFVGVRWSVLRAARRQETAPALDPQPASTRSIASSNDWLVVCWRSR